MILLMCSLPCNPESFSFVECKDYIQNIEIGKGMSSDTRCSWKLWPYIFCRCLRSEKASRWKSKAGGPSCFGSWDVVRMSDGILWFQRQAWPVWKLHDSLCDISNYDFSTSTGLLDDTLQRRKELHQAGETCTLCIPQSFLEGPEWRSLMISAQA